MTIQALIKFLPLPDDPFEKGIANEWLNVETAIGISLPNDYKEFINHYGSGSVCDFLYVFNPFSDNIFLNLKLQITERLDALRQLRKEDSENISHPLFPEPKGLLPWGGDR
jgi:hypothetical protein